MPPETSLFSSFQVPKGNPRFQKTKNIAHQLTKLSTQVHLTKIKTMQLLWQPLRNDNLTTLLFLFLPFFFSPETGDQKNFEMNKTYHCWLSILKSFVLETFTYEKNLMTESNNLKTLKHLRTLFSSPFKEHDQPWNVSNKHKQKWGLVKQIWKTRVGRAKQGQRILRLGQQIKTKMQLVQYYSI